MATPSPASPAGESTCHLALPCSAGRERPFHAAALLMMSGSSYDRGLMPGREVAVEAGMPRQLSRALLGTQFQLLQLEGRRDGQADWASMQGGGGVVELQPAGNVKKSRASLTEYTSRLKVKLSSRSPQHQPSVVSCLAEGRHRGDRHLGRTRPSGRARDRGTHRSRRACPPPGCILMAYREVTNARVRNFLPGE